MDTRAEIKAYLNVCKHQKNLSAPTLKAYAIDLEQFMAHIDSLPEKAITKAAISGYIIALHQNFQPKSVKRKLASLRAFFNYLEFEEIWAANPMRQMKTKFKEPKVLPKTIPLRLIESILIVAHDERSQARTPNSIFAALRDAAVVEMLFATGMRVSELCSLSTQDVNLIDGNIRIMGKGAKERVIQIGNGEVLAFLRQYHDARAARLGQAGYFFVNRFSARLSEQSVRFTLRRFREKSGMTQHITPHMFRHSFATLLLEEDVDIRYIQRMLGHSSIQTTQIYTQVTMEKQRQILVSKHPRNRIALQQQEI